MSFLLGIQWFVPVSNVCVSLQLNGQNPFGWRYGLRQEYYTLRVPLLLTANNWRTGRNRQAASAHVTSHVPEMAIQHREGPQIRPGSGRTRQSVMPRRTTKLVRGKLSRWMRKISKILTQTNVCITKHALRKALLQNNPVTANLCDNGIEISNLPYMLIIRPLRWRFIITA